MTHERKRSSSHKFAYLLARLSPPLHNVLYHNFFNGSVDTRDGSVKAELHYTRVFFLKFNYLLGYPPLCHLNGRTVNNQKGSYIFKIKSSHWCLKHYFKIYRPEWYVIVDRIRIFLFPNFISERLISNPHPSL